METNRFETKTMGAGGCGRRGSVVRSGLLLGALALGLAACTASGPPLDRGTYFLKIVETLDGEVTSPNIAEQLVHRALLLHGFREAKSRDEARYLLEGTLKCVFYKEHVFNKTTLEYQYDSSFEIKITDRAPAGGGEPAVEEIKIPKLINGRLDREDAKRDIRRLAATTMAERVVSERTFGRPAIKGLIDALGDHYDPRTFNDIVHELVVVGWPAVPYLLDALRDERPVKLNGAYPGLEEWNREELHYYHIADRALSDILRRESGLAIDSDESYWKSVIVGWTWAWEDQLRIPVEHRTHPEKRKNRAPAPIGPRSN